MPKVTLFYSPHFNPPKLDVMLHGVYIGLSRLMTSAFRLRNAEG